MKIVKFTIPVEIDNSIHLQEDKLPYFYEHLHRHTEIQITWVINGEGTLIVGNNMQPFNSGDLFVIGANQPHLFRSDPSYFVCFHTIILTRRFDGNGGSTILFNKVILQPQAKRALLDTFL